MLHRKPGVGLLTADEHGQIVSRLGTEEIFHNCTPWQYKYCVPNAKISKRACCDTWRCRPACIVRALSIRTPAVVCLSGEAKHRARG